MDALRSVLGRDMRNVKRQNINHGDRTLRISVMRKLTYSPHLRR